MRLAFGLVALLVVMGIVLVLSSSHTRQTVESVRVSAASLREDVAPRQWDARAAGAMLDRLTAFVDDLEPAHDELAAAAATAAGWVAATSPGSNDNHAAVKLRSAADELAQASASPDDRHRTTARGHLADARAALAGAPPNELDAVRGIRDQLENLQNSHREQIREPQEP
jgi:hypothetical protein